MKILADNAIPFLEERLAEAGVSATLLPGSRISSSDVRDAEALLVRTRTRCDASLLEGSSVRLVASATIGMDHIDSCWCASHGIRAVNAPGCNAPGVAQYVAAALDKAGFDPGRHTLGVVGKGNIGSLIAATARTASIRVVVSDAPRKDAGLTDEKYLTLDRLIEEADAITFHVPLTSTGPHPTAGLLDKTLISALRDGMTVINASRGGVIDEMAALQSDKEIKWIIDTWEGEPRLNREFATKAFIATPHIAGYSLQGKERATRSVIEVLNATFGLDISTDGLAEYDFLDNPTPWAHLAASYNPFSDSDKLKDSLSEFEIMRNGYALRNEK